MLLERDRDVDVLDAACARAAAGDGQLVVVEGSPGIGKSALLGETRRTAASAGFTVLTARASELESQFAFGVVRQLFESFVNEQPELLDGPAASAGPVFADDQPADGGGEVDDVSHSVLNGLYWLTLETSGRQPVMLVIDDLQWCDRSSLRFLDFLARRLDGAAMLVLLALRSGWRSQDGAEIARLVGDSAVTVVEPSPLSVDAVGELLRRRLGSAPHHDFANDCHRASGGNPLLVNELARALVAEGVQADSAELPELTDLGVRAVTRTVLLRLARLSSDAVAVAQALAVLGDSERPALLAAFTELELPALAAAVQELIRAEIVARGPSTGFVHPLVREAIYRDLSAVELQARHSRAALLLRDAHRPVERVAAHALALPPGDLAWAVQALQDAAHIAVSRGAPENAVAYLRRALDEHVSAEDRTALLLELGSAEALANEPVAAGDHLRAALAGLTDPMVRCRTAEVLARTLIFTSPPADVVEVTRAAQREPGAATSDIGNALAAVELYAARFGADDSATAARLAVPLPAGTGPGAHMLQAVAAWDDALTGGSADTCARRAEGALADGTLVVADPGFMAIVAAGVLVLADRDESLDVWSAILAAGHAAGSRVAVGGVRLWQGWNWLQRGALGDAADSLRQYLDVTDQRNDGHREAGLAYGAGFLARVLIEQGDTAGARLAVARAGVPTTGSDGDLQCRRGIIEVLLAEQRWAAALDAVTELGAVAGRVVNPGWVPRLGLAAAALRGLRRTEEAVAAAAQELEQARRWGAPGTVGAALVSFGAALDDHGDAACLEVLDEAVVVTEPSPARLEHAKALTACGSALRRHGRPANARPLLDRAADLATVCGAGPLAAHAAAELGAAGGRRLRRGITGVGALTPSEHRVAALAAAGGTNKAIARELFVTPKTVEVHLSSAYRKLGISSRADLVDLGLHA